MQLRRIRQPRVHAPEAERQSVGVVRFKDGQLRRAADVHRAAAGQSKPRVTGMNREHRAAGNKKAGAAGNGRAEDAAFVGNIFAGETRHRAIGPMFLRGRGVSRKNREQGERDQACSPHAAHTRGRANGNFRLKRTAMLVPFRLPPEIAEKVRVGTRYASKSRRRFAYTIPQ